MAASNTTIPGINVREVSFEDYVALELATALDCVAEVFCLPPASETQRDFDAMIEVCYLDPASLADALFA